MGQGKSKSKHKPSAVADASTEHLAAKAARSNTKHEEIIYQPPPSAPFVPTCFHEKIIYAHITSDLHNSLGTANRLPPEIIGCILLHFRFEEIVKISGTCYGLWFVAHGMESVIDVFAIMYERQKWCEEQQGAQAPEGGGQVRCSACNFITKYTSKPEATGRIQHAINELEKIKTKREKARDKFVKSYQATSVMLWCIHSAVCCFAALYAFFKTYAYTKALGWLLHDYVFAYGECAEERSWFTLDGPEILLGACLCYLSYDKFLEAEQSRRARRRGPACKKKFEHDVFTCILVSIASVAITYIIYSSTCHTKTFTEWVGKIVYLPFLMLSILAGIIGHVCAWGGVVIGAAVGCHMGLMRVITSNIENSVQLQIRQEQEKCKVELTPVMAKLNELNMKKRKYDDSAPDKKVPAATKLGCVIS